MTIYSQDSQYGPNLRAFVTYLLIELRLSFQKVTEHVSSLFDVALPSSSAHEIKSHIAEKYLPTYHDILRQISKGLLVHADETKGVVKGGGHYVWVFTNLTTVAYVYAESRESTILNDVLNGFTGVLVSDFYTAYDSVPCAQQKCLIHLMRDINEDLYKSPFDEDLKEIARRFGALLREIVETVDSHGLKARSLGKHKKAATGFIEHVGAIKCQAEAGLALQKRIAKNRDKLFTFLDYDGVPWNNNNAEHAVRALLRARLRHHHRLLLHVRLRRRHRRRLLHVRLRRHRHRRRLLHVRLRRHRHRRLLLRVRRRRHRRQRGRARFQTVNLVLRRDDEMKR
jgi:hypothetical protein